MPEQTKTLAQEFAIFLKAKRMSLGMTQRDLEIRCWGDDKRNGYIGKIENGKREISVNTMGIILEALNAWVEFIE